MLTSLAMPMIAAAIFNQAGSMASVIFIGQFTAPEYIGAAVLSNMLCNITGYSLAYGMIGSLDTLVAQAYGAKQYKYMGLITQRAMTILTIAVIPVMFIWRYSTSYILQTILLIDKTIADYANQYANYLLLGLWPMIMNEILKKFLLNQNIIIPQIISSFCSLLVNLGCNYLFIVHLNYGFIGAAMTTAVVNWFLLISLVILMLIRKKYIHYQRRNSSQVKYITLVNQKQTQPEITGSDNDEDSGNPIIEQNSNSMLDTQAENTVEDPVEDIDLSEDNLLDDENATKKDSAMSEDDPENNWPDINVSNILSDWYPFLALGIPGAVSLFLEWGSFEMAAGIAGQLGTSNLAVHSIYMQTAGILYMTPLAVASATSICVGNYIGAKEYKCAKEMVTLGMWIDVLLGLLAGLFLLALRDFWGGFFSSDAEVIGLVKKYMPIMLLYCVVDASKCITLNVLRSTGRPQITVLFNFVSCVVVLLPLGWFLAIYLDFKLYGLWGSMSAAWGICTFIYLYFIVNTKWEDQRFVDERNSMIH